MAHHSNHLRPVRKTRFVLVSDTHSTYPKLPKGDVLLHAGDLTNQGSISELRRTLDWIHQAECEIKVVIAGNHDITLDKQFYAEQGHNFHNQHPQNPDECLALINSYPDIIFLNHQSIEIQLTSLEGPQTSCKIFGSPYVPARGNWAFGCDHHSDSSASSLWSSIPLDTDIVLTHTPAYNHRDASPKWGAAGCEALRKALWRVRPRMAVCGHVHEGRGAERVKWRLDLPFSPYLEDETVQWVDPGAGNKKISLVDVTRRGGNPLLNDGSVERVSYENVVSFSDEEKKDGEKGMAWEEDDVDAPPSEMITSLSSSTGASMREHLHQESPMTERTRAERLPGDFDTLSRLHHHNTAALEFRYGRGETLIVNASIMAKSHGNGPKRFNKPIVVDLELPIGEEFA